jgi:hypothetical protein
LTSSFVNLPTCLLAVANGKRATPMTASTSGPSGLSPALSVEPVVIDSEYGRGRPRSRANSPSGRWPPVPPWARSPRFLICITPVVLVIDLLVDRNLPDDAVTVTRREIGVRPVTEVVLDHPVTCMLRLRRTCSFMSGDSMCSVKSSES